MHEIATSKVTDIREKVPQDMFDIGVKDWRNFVLDSGLLVGNCVHTINSIVVRDMDIPFGLHSKELSLRT